MTLGHPVGVVFSTTAMIDHCARQAATDNLPEVRRVASAQYRGPAASGARFIAGVLDTENAIVMVMDLDGIILRFNRAGEAATGFHAHELIGKPLWDTLLPKDQAAGFRWDFTAVLQGEFPRETEVQWHARDGERRLLQLSTTAILGDNGRCSHVVSTGIDITAQRQVQQALAFTQENFRFLVEGVTDYAIFMLDQDGTIISWNPGAERISGYSEAKVIGRHFGEILQAEEQAGLQPGTMLRIAGTDDYYQREGWFVRGDGSRFWAILAINPVRDDNRRLRGYSIIINDISERKQAETELARSRESLQALSRHLQTVREEEKASLARELHDELGSLLTSLKIELSALQQQLPGQEQARSDIDRINDCVQEAIATTRRISTSLRPPILDNLGLLPAVEWQLEQLKQRVGIEYDLHCDGDAAGLNQDQTIALFRILQEGLTNITRHAEAHRVSVVLIIDAQQAALDVIDDGIGFDFEDKSSGGSYGLYSMQERARALGGSLDIMSRAGEGTRLRVRIPVALSGAQQQEEPTP
ncbi:PAS domain S-box protein [Thiohalobacter thiocyanaticus]|uniref:PAS domain S-box protein n=1 Tax=Thiohalobacter thiocyanaticus TaxID=585455 RepID=A0A426QI61_9GAMM|nr:PAS domain S-box protein [Thiohalobacter thiocyanaticus]